MKQNKIESIFRRGLSFVLLSLLLPLGVGAQTNYDLWVGGVQVTSANAGNIISDNIISYGGKVEFNPEKNTLTLDDVKISNGCIVSKLSSLTIIIKGDVTLDCSKDSCTAIRSESFAPLTIVKGEDKCILRILAGRAIRDFQSVSLTDLIWDRTCAYQSATIANGEHTGMLLFDTVSEEIGDVNLSDKDNLPVPFIYSRYDDVNKVVSFGFEGDPSWEIRYSIDYVDESLADVTNTLYDMQGENVPLQGAATVTAWTVFGDATSDEVKGKLFELTETSLSTVYGTVETLSAPTLRPSIDPEDGIAVSYAGSEQSDVATINTSTGEVTILGSGSATFNVIFNPDDGCTVLNFEDLTFDVTIQKSYPLFIGDTQVTGANADDVLGDGTVSFVESGGQAAATTYTLNLNGATITQPIKVGLANLTFELREANTITTNEICIQNIAQTFVPSLTFMTNPDIEGSLILTNTNENGAISQIGQGSISVSNDLAVFLTVYGEDDYTSNLYYITDGSTTVAKIVPSYGVQIGEKQIYAGNAADVFDDRTVSFDKTTNTLTLNGASAGALCTSLAELTVELVGNNTLSEGGSYPVLRSLSGNAVIINVQSTADVMGTLTMNMPYTQAGNFCEDQVTLNIVAPLEVVSGSLKGNDDNKNTVVIGPNYGITITSAGSSNPITSDNRLDVLGDGGSVQFYGKNTLILNNASISSVILGADDSWVKKGLTIYLKGDNTIGEQEQDGLIYQGQGANVPLTFATGDVEPGKLTLSYSDQPLVGFTPTYLNNLTDMKNPDLHQITIAVSMEPFVTHSGEEKTEDGRGFGLGKDIEYAETSILEAGILVNKILYVLPDADDGYLLEDDKKVVAINSSMTDADANTIMAAVIDGSLLPGTPDFAKAFHGMTFLLPAGSGDIILDVNTNEAGELHVKVGNNDPVVISGTTGFEERRIPYALTEASYVLIYRTPTPSFSRFRASNRKIANTILLESVKVSARSVAATPPPVLMPKVLTKDDVAAAKSGNHITITDADVTDYADDAFEGQTGITYVDLSATSITGKIIDRTKLPAGATIFLPASNDDNLAKNIVIAGVCNNLQLNDAVDFEIPSDFTAVKASLSRNFTSDLGKNCTVCVPFALDGTQAAELGTFYTLSAHSENTITMESVDATEANKAYMFKPAKETFSAEMVDVKKADPVRTTVSSLSFLGTYQQIPALNSTANFVYYCFMQDGPQAGKFVKITSDVTVNPFRAYMELPASESLARALYLDFGEGGATGIGKIDNGKMTIDTYHDLQGRRVLHPKKGLYILNGKKVIIK